MIKLIDLMQDKGMDNVKEFKCLNDAVIESIKTNIDGYDESHREWLQFYLDNPKQLDNMSVARKIEEIESNNYKLYNKENVNEARLARNCQVCGDVGVKAYTFDDENYNELSVCTACLGIENRNSMYRHSRDSIIKTFKELEVLTRDIKDIKSFIDFAKKNESNPDFESFEINGRFLKEFNLDEIDENFKLETLRFAYKIMYVYMNTNTFKLDEEISVWDSEGELIADWKSYDEFYYAFHTPIRL